MFWAAACLVAAMGVLLNFGVFDRVPKGQVGADTLEDGSLLTLTGQVYQKDSDEYYLRTVSIISSAVDPQQTIPCKDNMICEIDCDTQIPLGSVVLITGVFRPFLSATNPGEFDAKAYYRTLGIGGRIKNAALLVQGEDFWPLREALYRLKNLMKQRFERALPQGDGAILCALLLGDKKELDPELKELYRQNGILHILSISSLHITILGMSLYRLLRRLRLPVTLAAVCGGVLMISYGFLTGFGVSACRAIAMYLIRMLGEVLGRTYDMLTALGVAGAVLVCTNPYYLRHSGFLLSFSSVIGVGALCPAIFDRKGRAAERRTGKLLTRLGGVKRGIGKSAAASLSVTLATLPIQLRCYYEVPVYAVFLNLLVIPFVKPLMLAGMAVALLPDFFPAAKAVEGILGWYKFLCGLFGKLPFHTWNPGCPKLWQVIVYYGISGLIILLAQRLKQPGKDLSAKAAKSAGKVKESGPVAAALTAAVCLLGFRPRAENRVVFLDVGQGDCILVQTASDENYLFDCGSSSRSAIGQYVLLPYLKYNGIGRLDAVFVSHPDEDHVNGILELLEMGESSNVEVRQLVLPDLSEEKKGEQLGEILNAVHAAGEGAPEIRYICAGDVWESASARFSCLHPQENCGWTDANTYSECFLVEFFWEGSDSNGARTAALLLTGDVEGQGEERLISELKTRGISGVDVLKVAHHGSVGTTSESLLEQITPHVAVISCGRNNRYGHPHPELLDRLQRAECRILQTKEAGAVTIKFQE